LIYEKEWQLILNGIERICSAVNLLLEDGYIYVRGKASYRISKLSTIYNYSTYFAKLNDDNDDVGITN
jgi:hypothetical protein